MIGTLGCRGPEPVPALCEDAPLKVAVQAGDYLRVLAHQGPRDVALSLTTPGGRNLEFDSLNLAGAPPWPDEEIHWLADASGEARIAGQMLTGPRGLCGLRLAEHRKATPADRLRVEAEAELARAHALRRTWEGESCRAAVAPYESTERRFAALGLPWRRAEAQVSLALLQRRCLREPGEALRTLLRTEPWLAGHPAFEAMVRQSLGEVRDDLGNVDGAITDYRRALELGRYLSPAGAALVEGNLAANLHRRGLYDEAAAHFDRALDLWPPAGDPRGKGTVLVNRGHLDRDLGEMERARHRFEEALPLFREAHDAGGEAATLNALGLLALDEGRPAKALKPFEEALALRAPGTRGWAVTRTSLGVAHRQLGRRREARRAYEEAVAVFHRLGDAREEARSLANLGRLEAEEGTGTTAAALGHLDRAIRLFQDSADPSNLAWALEEKARILSRGGDPDGALALMTRALDVIERHRYQQPSLATRAAFFSTQQEPYGFLVRLLLDLGRKGEALEAHERSLARSLLDGLSTRGLTLERGAGDPVLRARERRIEQEIDSRGSLRARLSEDPAATPEQTRSIEQELGRLWEDLDRVRAGLRLSDPRYAALTQPLPWKASEIQHRLLDADTLLLEYRLAEPRSHLWAVTPDSLETFELAGRSEIEHAARAASWRRPGEAAARLQLDRLSHLLLGPAARLLPGKRLLVVGNGVLQTLPFAALKEPATGEPLIARHEIVTLPSASLLGALRREVAGRTPAPKALWVLSSPDFGTSFEPIQHSRAEADAILARVPAAGRQQIEGRAASRAAVLTSRLSDFRILHFATHGSFDDTDPGGARLVLAQVAPDGRPEPNGFLYTPDIYALDLRADLVVLSACQSALGKELRGEGMMGMTRGFFYAGAERVLVSLWNVDDQAAAELMRRFYEGVLRAGLSPAAALRAAQDGIRSQPRWRSPYYWAGFTMQGEWRGFAPRPSSIHGQPEKARRSS